MREVNLASRPFVNERPVRRLALLALVAGLTLTAVNGWLYTRYLVQRGANAGELDRISEQIVVEEQRVSVLSERLRAADLTQQNELVAFLNQQIAERTFGWSVLFDRLEVLLPEDVRLVSLSPRDITGPQVTNDREEQLFNLAITGISRQPEAVLELIDALFADPAFRDPDPHGETFRDGSTSFTLDVVYLPDVAEALAGDGTPAGTRATATGASTVLGAADRRGREEER